MVDRGMRRGDKQIIDQTELYRILDEAKVIRLGMLDGERPYVVPVNFARDGDEIWFHAAPAGRKLDCLRAAPAVCVEADRLIELHTGPSACDDWTSYYESVIGSGTAEFIVDRPTKLHALRAIMLKYSGRDDWEFADASVDGTAVVRVRLDSLTGKCSPARG